MKIKRPTKYAVITAIASEEVNHLGTKDISRKRMLAVHELNLTEGEISELTMRLAESKEKFKKIVATIDGYNIAVGKR